MLAVTSPRHGAILNRHDGAEAEYGLTTTVTKTCSGSGRVEVIGIG